MQWLNSLDAALDRAFLPRPNSSNTIEDERSDRVTNESNYSSDDYRSSRESPQAIHIDRRLSSSDIADDDNGNNDDDNNIEDILEDDDGNGILTTISLVDDDVSSMDHNDGLPKQIDVLICEDEKDVDREMTMPLKKNYNRPPPPPPPPRYNHPNNRKRFPGGIVVVPKSFEKNTGNNHNSAKKPPPPPPNKYYNDLGTEENFINYNQQKLLTLPSQDMTLSTNTTQNSNPESVKSNALVVKSLAAKNATVKNNGTNQNMNPLSPPSAICCPVPPSFLIFDQSKNSSKIPPSPLQYPSALPPPPLPPRTSSERTDLIVYNSEELNENDSNNEVESLMKNVDIKRKELDASKIIESNDIQGKYEVESEEELTNHDYLDFDEFVENDSDSITMDGDDQNALKDKVQNIKEKEDHSLTSKSEMTYFTDSDIDYSVDSTESPWNYSATKSTLRPFHPSMNCHGVIHVRLFVAQHLNCEPGKTILTTISLPPWNGCIRADSSKSYQGRSSYNAGTCVRWRNNLGLDGNQFYSMIHAYNNEDTPVPSISISLTTKSLKMFESKICSFLVSSEPLMRQPGVWRRKWCKSLEDDSTVAGKLQEEDKDISDNNECSHHGPLLLLEACFEPSHTENSLAISMTNPLDIEGDKTSSLMKNPEETQKGIDSAFIILDQSLDGNSTVGNSTLKSTSIASPMRLKGKSHLFRIAKSWTPSYCSVCSSLMGWRLQAYCCEVCNVYCCSDCQIQVDVKIPCGSNLSKEISKKKKYTKFEATYLFNLILGKEETQADSNLTLTEVSIPQERSNSTEKRQLIFGDENKIDTDTENEIVDIGTLKLSVVKACLYEKSFPPEMELDEIFKIEKRALRVGDHYVRVAWSGSKETKRTKVVLQTAKPCFDSEELHIPAAHYGTEFRIEVIDATTDKPVGTSLLTTQGLLQMQRDYLIAEEGLTISSILSYGQRQLNMRKFRLELRTGVKSGFGLDFFNSGKSKDLSKSDRTRTSRSGEIMGWIEVDMCMIENSLLYSSRKPKLCPPRPEEEFNVDLIQVHINRISAIIEELRELSDSVIYLTGWENPILTLTSMVIFVYSCIYFNSEYVGSLPLLFLVMYMSYFGYVRLTGRFKMRWVKREKEARKANEEKMRVKYNIHRSIGILKARVTQGKNLRSPELGLPGSVVATILWDPLKYSCENDKKKIVDCDTTTKGVHEVGFTDKSAITSNPEWECVISSHETKRLQQLLPNDIIIKNHDSTEKNSIKSFSELFEEDSPYVFFPLLQPISPGSKSIIQGKNYYDADILPWESSTGAVIVQIRFHDIMNKLPGIDDVLGEVTIPFSKLLENKSVDGWFQVLEKGCNETVVGPSEDMKSESIDELLPNEHSDNDVSITGSEIEIPEIKINLSFMPPGEEVVISEREKEASIVIAEEMTKSVVLSQDAKVGIIGTSISTFNTVRGVRGNIQYIQNQLGYFLDIVEMIRNTMNFSCPEKSAILFLLLLIIWILLAIVPTRILVLCGGLGHYVSTFSVAFRVARKRVSVSESTNSDKGKDSVDYNPVVTQISNLFTSIPTDEDLRRAYFWESKRIEEKDQRESMDQKRKIRLKKLWNAKWYGCLDVKVRSFISSESDFRQWNWEQVFVVFFGHRLIWWKNSADFDDGESPLGQIIFAGHSGLAGLSPLDQRELHEDEIPLVLGVFGRGMNGQQKVTFLCPQKAIREELETLIIKTCTDEKNE